MRETPDLECVRCTHTRTYHTRKVVTSGGTLSTGCRTCACASFTPGPLPPTLKGDAEPDVSK